MNVSPTANDIRNSTQNILLFPEAERQKETNAWNSLSVNQIAE